MSAMRVKVGGMFPFFQNVVFITLCLECIAVLETKKLHIKIIKI